MDSAVDQSRLLAKGSAALRLPAAYIVCNQSPPVDDQPSLMTFRCGPHLTSIRTSFAGPCLASAICSGMQ